MSESLPEIPSITINNENSLDIYKFAAIVDGILVTTFRVHPQAAAVLGNNPIFIQVPESFQVPYGSRWDGTSFISDVSIES